MGIKRRGRVLNRTFDATHSAGGPEGPVCVRVRVYVCVCQIIWHAVSLGALYKVFIGASATLEVDGVVRSHLRDTQHQTDRRTGPRGPRALGSSSTCRYTTVIPVPSWNRWDGRVRKRRIQDGFITDWQKGFGGNSLHSNGQTGVEEAQEAELHEHGASVGKSHRTRFEI